MKATKRYKAEVAHRLVSSYSTRCQSIHGHSYLFEVTLEDENLNCDGMVMDFGEMKDKVDKPFLDKWDHALILYEKDPMLPVMRELAIDHKQRFLVTDYNPTAENMAYHIFRFCVEQQLPVTEVRVQETLTGWATVNRVDDSVMGFKEMYNV